MFTQIDLSEKLVVRLIARRVIYHEDLRKWVHIDARDVLGNWQEAKWSVLEEAKDIARWACSQATRKQARKIGTYKFVRGMTLLAKWDARVRWADDDLLSTCDAPGKLASGVDLPTDAFAKAEEFARRLKARVDKPDEGLH
jgi:hypothetical protein